MLPREADALFAQPDHPDHLKCALPGTAAAAGPTYGGGGDGGGGAPDGGIKPPPHAGREVRLKFDLGAARPLPCPAGTVLMWTGNTVHWGSSCSSRAPVPRQSIALAFRAAAWERSHLELDMPGLTLAEVQVAASSAIGCAVPVATRLRLVVKGLALFKWWWGDDVPAAALPGTFWREVAGACAAWSGS